jgi:hypothetical protein
VAEWFKAAVLKTVERELRGFESLLLRHVLLDRSAVVASTSAPLGEVAERLKALPC